MVILVKTNGKYTFSQELLIVFLYLPKLVGKIVFEKEFISYLNHLN